MAISTTSCCFGPHVAGRCAFFTYRNGRLTNRQHHVATGSNHHGDKHVLQGDRKAGETFHQIEYPLVVRLILTEAHANGVRAVDVDVDHAVSALHDLKMLDTGARKHSGRCGIKAKRRHRNTERAQRG